MYNHKSYVAENVETLAWTTQHGGASKFGKINNSNLSLHVKTYMIFKPLMSNFRLYTSYNYMHSSLMGKMRLLFIDSELLYRGAL